MDLGATIPYKGRHKKDDLLSLFSLSTNTKFSTVLFVSSSEHGINLLGWKLKWSSSGQTSRMVLEPGITCKKRDHVVAHSDIRLA